MCRTRTLEHIDEGRRVVPCRDQEERASGPHDPERGTEVRDRVCQPTGQYGDALGYGA